jgi:hypothetical protein
MYNHGHNTSRSPIFSKKAAPTTSNERKNNTIISQHLDASSKEQKRAKKHNATTMILNKETEWGNTQMIKASKPTGNTI